MDGLTVRDWLAGKDYDSQYRFGINVLKDAMNQVHK